MPPREPKETQKEPQKNKNELKNKKIMKKYLFISFLRDQMDMHV